jgi:hypothetical protein
MAHGSWWCRCRDGRIAPMADDHESGMKWWHSLSADEQRRWLRDVAWPHGGVKAAYDKHLAGESVSIKAGDEVCHFDGTVAGKAMSAE